MLKNSYKKLQIILVILFLLPFFSYSAEKETDNFRKSEIENNFLKVNDTIPDKEIKPISKIGKFIYFIEKLNVKAGVGFLLSINGGFFPFTLAGLIFSILGLREINKAPPETYTGKGFAIAGIIISSVTIVLIPVLFILFMRAVLNGMFDYI